MTMPQSRSGFDLAPGRAAGEVGSRVGSATEWSRGGRLAKRAMDLVVGGAGLLVGLAAAPWIALAIWLEDRGPVLYSQSRVGLGGRPFRLWKFRTMSLDAEPRGEARWASPDDPRATRVGGFLRTTHLDELPQFWSVVRGSMSLVGPRPERPELLPGLTREIPGYAQRTAVRPGITGPAQLILGYVNSIEGSAEKVEIDLAYIRHRSLMLDLHCVARTVWMMLVDLAGFLLAGSRFAPDMGGPDRLAAWFEKHTGRPPSGR